MYQNYWNTSEIVSSIFEDSKYLKLMLKSAKLYWGKEEGFSRSEGEEEALGNKLSRFNLIRDMKSSSREREREINRRLQFKIYVF